MKWVVPQTLNIVSTNLSDTTNLLDSEITTQVERSESFYVELDQGIVDVISLLGVEATTVKVELIDITTGTITKTYAIDTRDESYGDIWGYFYDEFLFRKDIYLDLILTYGMKIKITLLNVGTAKLGKIITGRASKSVDMLTTHTPNMLDFSSVDRATDGKVTFVSGAYAKKLSITLAIDVGDFSRMLRRLYDIRGKQVLFIGDGGEHTIIFGFIRDFDGQYEFENKIFIGLNVEGLI